MLDAILILEYFRKVYNIDVKWANICIRPRCKMTIFDIFEDLYLSPKEIECFIF